MKFKKPKNSPYFVHCYECKYYTFEKQVGCAYLGTCTGLRYEPRQVDAYGSPCGLWEKKQNKKDKAESKANCKSPNAQNTDVQENQNVISILQELADNLPDESAYAIKIAIAKIKSWGKLKRVIKLAKFKDHNNQFYLTGYQGALLLIEDMIEIIENEIKDGKKTIPIE